MKTTLLFLSVFLSVNLFGQNVYIPDANFKNYLVNNFLINTSGDNEIQVSEASSFTGAILCNDLSISDLTGIEAFTALTYLVCYNNQLTSLDISNNTALTLLSFSNNQIISLDLSNNTFLTDLYCEYNQLTSLDVSNNTVLIRLHCFFNQLECLNIKNGNNHNMIIFLADANPNLTCIEVDDAGYSSAMWFNNDYAFDPQTSFSENCNNDCSTATATTIELTSSKNLIQILDLMGRETSFKPNTPLIYVYDNGSTEKVFTIE